MTTTIIIQAAASSMLLLNTGSAYTCESIHTRPEFYFNNLVFNQNAGQADSLSPDVESVDANSFLDDLVAKHSLEDRMPAARAWVAEEFYAAQTTLAVLRLNAGLTQAQLAHDLGIPQSSIARLESGSENPTIERAKAISDALGVSLDDFYIAFNGTRTSKSA